MTEPNEVDSLIRQTIEASLVLDSMRDIGSLPVFRRVVAEYLKQSPDEAANKTHALIYWLGKLDMRALMIRHGVGGIELDNEWEDTRRHWREQQKELEKLLNDAAELFDSGQDDPMGHPTLTEYRERDKSSWCGSEQLRKWAALVAKSPVEAVFPIAIPALYGIAIPNQVIGKRGGAANPDSAFRGVVIRMIAYHVPETMKSRYSTIAELAERFGVSVNRQYVRSLLLEGHT